MIFYIVSAKELQNGKNNLKENNQVLSVHQTIDEAFTFACDVVRPSKDNKFQLYATHIYIVEATDESLIKALRYSLVPSELKEIELIIKDELLVDAVTKYLN